MTRTVRLTTGAAVTIAALALAGQAFAWDGAKAKASCPQQDQSVTHQDGDWQFQLTDNGVLVKSGILPSPAQGSKRYSFPYWPADGAAHDLVLSVGSAADINDGLVTSSVTVFDCTPPAGTPGPGGPAGPKGDNGAFGAPGAKGATGPAGVQGAPGTPGKDGAPGSAGPQGITGGTGANGQNGATGPTGAPGSPGGVGAVGSAGPTGRPGAAGHPGKQGATGHTGTAGKPGRAGASGHAGKAGKAGVTRVVHLTIVKHVAAPKPSPFVCHGCQPKVAG